jgi:hypothetical protein
LAGVAANGTLPVRVQFTTRLLSNAVVKSKLI